MKLAMYSKINNNNDGFSNLDTILGILIISFVLPSLIGIIQDVNTRSVNHEIIDKGTVFANTVMHYITGSKFDDNYGSSGPPWTYPLGQEDGNFDDIDDFINMDWSIIPGFSDSGFSAVTNVFYVDVAVDLMSMSNNPTNHKRIAVIIDHNNLNSPITLTTLITPHGS